MVYQWSGFGFPVPAQNVGEELEKLEAENGSLTKENIVDAARPETSVLHKLFEWDDQKAGEQWRKHQAKNMLSCLHIVVNKNLEGGKPQTVSIRAYTNVAIDDSKTPARYVFTIKGIAEDEKATILANVAQEIEDFIRKYRTYEELADLIVTLEDWENKYKRAV